MIPSREAEMHDGNTPPAMWLVLPPGVILAPGEIVECAALSETDGRLRTTPSVRATGVTNVDR